VRTAGAEHRYDEFILLRRGSLLRPEAASRNWTPYLRNMCTDGVHITGSTAPDVVHEVSSGKHLQKSSREGTSRPLVKCGYRHGDLSECRGSALQLLLKRPVQKIKLLCG
jgi:hypothetical protein